MTIRFWSSKNSFLVVLTLSEDLYLFDKNIKIIFVIELKKYETSASILDIIIGKFSH